MKIFFVSCSGDLLGPYHTGLFFARFSRLSVGNDISRTISAEKPKKHRDPKTQENCFRDSICQDFPLAGITRLAPPPETNPYLHPVS